MLRPERNTATEVEYCLYIVHVIHVTKYMSRLTKAIDNQSCPTNRSCFEYWYNQVSSSIGKIHSTADFFQLLSTIFLKTFHLDVFGDLGQRFR